MEDKLNAIDAAWQQTKATQEEFEVAGRIEGFDLADYIEYIYDQAIKDLGDEIEKNLPEYMDNEVRQTLAKEAAARDEWLLKSGLSRMQQWRIRQKPLDRWRGQTRRRKAEVPVRLINVPAITRCLAGDQPEGDGVRLEFFGPDGFTFLDLVVYSTLCEHWDKGIKTITMRGLLEHLNPGEQWRHQDHDEFVEAIKGSIDRITSIGVEIDGEASELLEAEVLEDTIINIKHQSMLWERASKKSGIINIPAAWLQSGRCRIGWLDRLYVARRVKLANYKAQNMPSKINLVSMSKAVGHEVSSGVVMGYLGHLVRREAITGITIANGTVAWSPVTDGEETAYPVKMTAYNAAGKEAARQ